MANIGIKTSFDCSGYLSTMFIIRDSPNNRNNALFNIAIYFKQSDPDTWQDKVVEANLKD